MSVIARFPGYRAIRFARMAGSSIAAPDAAGWVTDFLNAAYYARSPEERDVDDLRLALGILTTRWHRLGRRLRAHDVLGCHRAFGARPVAARAPPQAHARAAARGRRAAARRLVRRRVERPGAARLGHRVRGPRARAPDMSPSGGCATPRSDRSRRRGRRRGTGRPTRRSRCRRRTPRSRRCPIPRGGPTSAARSGASPRCAAAGSRARRSRSRSSRKPRRARRCSRAAMSPRPRCSTTRPRSQPRSNLPRPDSGSRRCRRARPRGCCCS